MSGKTSQQSRVISVCSANDNTALKTNALPPSWTDVETDRELVLAKKY